MRFTNSVFLIVSPSHLLGIFVLTWGFHEHCDYCHASPWFFFFNTTNEVQPVHCFSTYLQGIFVTSWMLSAYIVTYGGAKHRRVWDRPHPNKDVSDPACQQIKVKKKHWSEFIPVSSASLLQLELPWDIQSFHCYRKVLSPSYQGT